MIPLIDLSIDNQISKEIEKQLNLVINSKNYILGPRLEAFEQKFAKFIGTKYSIGVANGTDALRLSLRAFGIGNGDKVLTVALTSPFTSIAIVEEGAIPVYCDVDINTFTIDLCDAEKKIDKKTKAIIPVHIYGNPCNMDMILKFAKRYKLKIIEDACQAHGAEFKGKKIGSFGDTAAFSFYPTKNLGAFGDAGIIVTNNQKIAKKIKLLRHGGQTKRFWHVYSGINSRLDEIQAAVLEIKLRYLSKENQKRAILAKRYNKGLLNLPIKFQESFDGAESSNHLFVIRTKKRNLLKKSLASQGIMTDIYYPYPVHLQPLFKKYSSCDLPVTLKLSKELLALPLYPALSFQKQDIILKAVKNYFQS